MEWDWNNCQLKAMAKKTLIPAAGDPIIRLVQFLDKDLGEEPTQAK